MVSQSVPQPASYVRWQDWANAWLAHSTEEERIGQTQGVALYLAAYPKGRLPRAAEDGVLIYVVDEVGGKTVAFSADGQWYRVQDRVVVS